MYTLQYAPPGNPQCKESLEERKNQLVLMGEPSAEKTKPKAHHLVEEKKI